MLNVNKHLRSSHLFILFNKWLTNVQQMVILHALIIEISYV